MDKAQMDLTPKELIAFKYIRNQFVHFNRAPSVRDVMHHLNSKSPRSAELVINRLIEKSLLERDAEDAKLTLLNDIFKSSEKAHTVKLPVIGRISAGAPLLAEDNVESYIDVDEKLLKGSPEEHYLLRVHGNSMNLRGIENGDLALVRMQSSADKGQNVIAVINDEATVKEFIPAEDKVILMPHSTDKSIQPIVLQEEFLIQGIVLTTIPSGIFG